MIPKPIAFGWHALASSSRWVAPTLFYGFWLALSISGQTPAPVNEVAVFMVPALIPAACWLTYIVGSLDDAAHRDLMAAAIGGPRRLHVARLVLALAISIGIALITILTATIDAIQDFDVVSIGLGLLALVGAACLGVGIGAALVPPINTQVGLAVGGTILALALVMTFPGMQWCLRSVNDGEADGALVLAMFGTVFVGTMAMATAQAARMRVV